MSLDSYDTNRPLTIYVSDRAFGADDVIATSMLTLLFERSSIIQTSKKPPTVGTGQNIWLNVTHTYDPEHGFFDANCEAYLDVDEESRREFAHVRLSVCGQIWKAFGQLLLQKFGAQDEDFYVFKSVYREFIQPLDTMAKSPITLPGSFIYVLNSFNAIGNEQGDNFRDAVFAAGPLLSRVIKAHVLRGDLYTSELKTLELAFTDRDFEELLILPVRCNAVHLFLKDYDPQQEVKFIIQPRNEQHNTWQIWAVDYKRRRFQMDVPLLAPAEASAYYPHLKIRTIHPGRYLAVTCDLLSAIELAKVSLQRYQKNYFARLKRWWFDE
jgi:uncharacterized UPF0160 family protein